MLSAAKKVVTLTESAKMAAAAKMKEEAATNKQADAAKKKEKATKKKETAAKAIEENTKVASTNKALSAMDTEIGKERASRAKSAHTVMAHTTSPSISNSTSAVQEVVYAHHACQACAIAPPPWQTLGVMQHPEASCTGVRRRFDGSKDNYIIIDADDGDNGLVNGTVIVITGDPVHYDG